MRRQFNPFVSNVPFLRVIKVTVHTKRGSQVSTSYIAHFFLQIPQPKGAMKSFKWISQTNYFHHLLRIKFQKNYSISNTGGLAKLLVLKVNGRVLIVTNIDISGRLINEQTGTFKHIETKENIV